MFTSNDFLIFVYLFVIISLSIILLHHEFPDELNFKTGSIIAMIVFVSMIITSDLNSNLESAAFLVIMTSIVFFIGGFFGKWASHDKDKITDRYWFWMIIIMLIISLGVVGYSFYDNQFGTLNSVSQVILTESVPITQEYRVVCSTDPDCEPNKCIHNTCHTIQEETLSSLTEEDWENYWRARSNTDWSLINDNENYYLKNNGNDWLKFNYDIYNLSFIEFKVNIEQGGVMINFNNDYSSDKRDFLEFGNEHIEITNYESETYTVLGYQSLDLNSGVWHTIKIKIEEQISVYLNEELILSNITYERYNEDLLDREFSIESNENPIIYIDEVSYTSGGYEPIIIS